MHKLRNIFGLIIFSASLSLQATTIEITGRVVSVADGDTITILEEGNKSTRIRFSGVDAPEKAQPYGKKSKQHLSELVYDKTVKAECIKQDQYQRQVCTVFIGDQNIGLLQVQSGYAWWDEKYAKNHPPERVKQYEKAHQNAKKEHLALWRDPKPVPPWEWRKIKKVEQQSH